MKEPKLRWFAEIPILTNPLILWDGVVLMVILWFFSVAFLATLQRFFGGMLTWLQIIWACQYASWLILAVVGVFVLITFLVFRNRYAALYVFDTDGIYVESFRGIFAPLNRESPFIARPMTSHPEILRSSVKVLPWERITGYQVMVKYGVVLVRGRRHSVMRVYCPDDSILQSAVDWLERMT